jgi:hypothetical protein
VAFFSPLALALLNDEETHLPAASASLSNGVGSINDKSVTNPAENFPLPRRW